MLTRIEVNVETSAVYVETINADAASGNVLPGPDWQYKHRDIIDWCNDNLAAPYGGFGDYSDFSVVRIGRGEVKFSIE